jgi:2-desacetyl-2-hydroxyethyl bacteriochlorophyllide A dehydrogenase
MNSNRAVVFTGPKEVIIQDEPMPVPGTDQVLVQTWRTLISTGTELTILSGEFPSDSAWWEYAKFPFRPGYNNVGVVVETGANVDSNLVGRTICSYAPHCAYHAFNPADSYLVPDGVSDDQAVFFTLAEIALIGIRRSHIELGEAIVVYGAGLIGQLVARFCRLSGARPVIVVDVAESRLNRVDGCSGLLPVNAAKSDVPQEVGAATKGRMADVVFETTGNPSAIPGEFAALRRGGRFVVLSSPRGKTLFDFHDLCNSPSITIIGAHNSSHPACPSADNPWTRSRDVELFFELLASDDIATDALVSHREPYNNAPAIYRELLEDRSRAMGVILNW